MARDYEDIHDLDDLNGEELRSVIRDHLAEHNGLDGDRITVQIDHGTVILGGTVGTDGERLIAERVVTDVLGIERVQNEIFVDATQRATNPEAIDEKLAKSDQTEGLALGDREVTVQAEAEDEEVREDLDADLYGTTDVRKAIEEGTAWNPPDSPTQEGFTGRGEIGENH
jgi:hypothetical protein